MLLFKNLMSILFLYSYPEEAQVDDDAEVTFDSEEVEANQEEDVAFVDSLKAKSLNRSAYFVLM